MQPSPETGGSRGSTGAFTVARVSGMCQTLRSADGRRRLNLGLETTRPGRRLGVPLLIEAAGRLVRGPDRVLATARHAQDLGQIDVGVALRIRVLRMAGRGEDAIRAADEAAGRWIRKGYAVGGPARRLKAEIQAAPAVATFDGVPAQRELP